MSMLKRLVVSAVMLRRGSRPGAGPAVRTTDRARRHRALGTSASVRMASGLPPGRGTANQGEAVYAAKCQACHGEKGAGGPNDTLVGGIGSLAPGKVPVKTVGSYWPYATTLFDYVRRAMPFPESKSLTDDELYAVSAYILNLNGIVGTDDVLDAQIAAQGENAESGWVHSVPAESEVDLSSCGVVVLATWINHVDPGIDPGAAIEGQPNRPAKLGGKPSAKRSARSRAVADLPISARGGLRHHSGTAKQ